MREFFPTLAAKALLLVLKGVAISPDNDLNNAVYNVKAKEMLTGKPMTLESMPPSVRIFPRTLARYSIR